MKETLNSTAAILAQFADEYRVPAVVGGVVTSDGTLRYDVVGVRSRGGAEPAARTDQWHIGSCGKSITAALYGRLVDRGVASWGIPVRELFADLGGDVDSGWGDRTIDQVFHCRAGMRANLSMPRMRAARADRRPLPEQRTDAAAWALRVAPKPADRFVYSNLGYIVVGAAIDRLTGSSFEAALESEILTPLGMGHVGFGAPPDIWGHRSRLQLANVVAFAGGPVDPKNPLSDNPRVLSSAGTMHMTIADWAKFQRVFLTAGGNLLRPETIAHLLRHPAGRGNGMAMGWGTTKMPGVSHGMQGSNALWAATALVGSGSQRTAMVACNDGRTRVLLQTAIVASRLLSHSD